MGISRRAVMGVGLAAASFLEAAGARAAVETEGDAARYASAIADIQAYAEQHMAANGLVGLTLALAGRGGFAAQLRFGDADRDLKIPVGPNHLFQIGSISKSFTALCIFRLMEAGKLKLEDDARAYLPTVPWPAGKTTIQDLLNHGSGLADDPPAWPRGGDQKLWRGFEPGTQWSYSNLGFALLGKIVAEVSGKPFPDAVQSLVLAPLGMTATKPAIVTADRALYASGYSPFHADRAYPRAGKLGPGPWTPMVEGSGSVASTGRDMIRYMDFLMEAGAGRGKPLLSDANALRYVTATLDAPGWAVKGAKYANGLAVVPIGGRSILHHTGGMLTFSSAIHVDPQAGVGAFASTNAGLIPYRPRDLTAYAVARMRVAAEGATAPKATPAPMPPRLADTTDFTGRFVDREGAAIEIRTAPRGISVQTATRTLEMEPGGEDAFIAVDPSQATHTLVFRRTGNVVRRFWWGDTEYVHIRESGGRESFTAQSPAPLLSVTGHYENDNPWRGGFRITAQGDTLYLDGTTPLIPMADGGFRVGDKAWSPERVHFDALIGGRTQRATLSGVDYERRPT